MILFEMEGFLRGKCIPRDLMVNETNAEYLVRKLAEAEAKCAALLDELEAKDKRIVEQNTELFKQSADIAELTLSRKNAWRQASAARQGFDEQFSLRETAEKRIAELEARRVPDSFNIIGENIRTQDNRITSEPIFCVFQKREIVVDEDYDCDRIVWVDEEGCEATERQRMRLELLHDNCRETPDKWRRIAVKDIDDFVTCCFTEQGCKDYLACNGHNLRLPFIYVKSGFRNAEYIGIRNWLAGIGKGE